MHNDAPLVHPNGKGLPMMSAAPPGNVSEKSSLGSSDCNTSSLKSSNTPSSKYKLLDPSQNDTFTTLIAPPDILTPDLKVPRPCRVCNTDALPWSEQQFCSGCNQFFHMACYNKVVRSLQKQFLSSQDAESMDGSRQKY